MKDYLLNWNQLICLASSAISQIIALNNVEVNTTQSLAEEGNSQHRHCLKRLRTKADIGKSMAPVAHTHEGLVATHVHMPGQSFQGGFLFLLLFQVFVVLLFCCFWFCFVTNHHCNLILAALHIQRLLNRKYYTVLNTTCHYSSGNSGGSNKILLILGKTVPSDQKRGQCRDTAISAHHLLLAWLACISFFSSTYSQNLFFPFTSVRIYKAKQFLISTLT